NITDTSCHASRRILQSVLNLAVLGCEDVSELHKRPPSSWNNLPPVTASFKMFEDLCIVLAVMLTLCVAEPRVEEVVYPRILEARGPNGKKMVYIRDGLTLSLEKSKVFSENFTFTEGDSMNYTNKAINVNDIEDSLYQDNKHGSSVVLKESNGSVEI
ncbi:hypothetical protein HPB47_006448, partial [Ixodes persulcatus]